MISATPPSAATAFIQTGFVAGFLLAIGTPGLAQSSPASSPYSGSLQGYIQSWRIEEAGEQRDVTQTVLPIGFLVPVADGWDVRVTSSYVSLSQSSSESSEQQTISGISDLKLQVNTVQLNQRLLVALSANLPTGKRELTGTEQDLLQTFVAPDLSVRANRFGEGLNLGGAMTYGFELNPATLAAFGFGVIHRGSYALTFPGTTTPVDLKPGFEASLTGSVLHRLGVHSFRVGTGVTFHGMEQVDDRDAFRLGPRAFFEALYSRPLEGGRGRMVLSVKDLYRMKETSGLDSDLTRLLDTNGNYLVADGGIEYDITRWIGLGLDGTGRLIGNNSRGVGGVSVLEGGLTTRISPVEALSIRLGGRFIVGSGTGYSGEERHIQGIEGLINLSAWF
jgi:hypothetical protein